MNLDNLDKFLEKVPMHYGEAVQLYPWIKETNCEDYEWCNRTSLENAIWLIEQLELRLSKFNQRVDTKNICSRHDWQLIAPNISRCRKCGAIPPF